MSPAPRAPRGNDSHTPDGRRIAFQSERDNPLRGIKRVTDIYTMRVDGTDVRRLTTTDQPGLGNGVRHPSWSPDGAWIGFFADNQLKKGARVLGFNYDTGERYLSIEGFLPTE